jgi:DNA-binding NarL/FixJ family response regulator
MTIRILLVDDQALFREGLRTLLSIQPNLEIVGEAKNGQQGLDTALDLKPDVVLMDLRMPVLDGVAATRRIREKLPECQVIVLTTFDDDEYVFEALRAGAAGYLLKDVSSDKLIEAIQAAVRGESFLQPSVASKVLAEFTRLADQRSQAADQPLVEP